jgi:glycine cleavage system H protein
MAGTVTEVNQGLLEDPSAINADKYGDGWLFSLQAPINELLNATEYVTHLEKAWEVAQKTIKGQVNG